MPFGRVRHWAHFLVVLGMVGCGKPRPSCENCGTVVVAAVAEPTTLVPAVVFETVGRDISDQIFERLADLQPGGSPIDPGAYRPGLAERWERIDSLAWRFHLRPKALWQDGKKVTAEDVVFSFDAFSDSLLDAPARSYLAGRVRAVAEDSSTVRVVFSEPSPEQLYDATYHVRIIPQHIWKGIPRERWASDTMLAHLVGSGSYRLHEWRRGHYLTIVADSAHAGADKAATIRRVIWRFAPDPDAALNLILGHEADLMEAVGAPDRVARVARDSSFHAIRYPAAVYGFLAFRVADLRNKPHPILGNREVRRALTQALDRPRLARALFGAGVKVPPGPMSQLLWIWDDRIRTLPFDSTHAHDMLDRLKREHPVGPIDILVPSTSPTRRQLAVAIQEAWRKLGVNATVTTVDFPVFQTRLAKGRFDSYIGAYLDEPSPRGLADQWSRTGWGVLNYGRYSNPVFDSLMQRAQREGDVAKARVRWREAMDTLNVDAPGIFLYALANVAAVQRRLHDVALDPYSWLSGLSKWRVEEGHGTDGKDQKAGNRAK
jgi:peptide/nickel transport system substrate-binding protein